MTAPAGPIAITRLEDVRPGDLMFAGMSGAPAKAVVYGGQLVLGEFVAVGELIVGHVAIVVEASATLPPGSVYRGTTYETGVITAPRIVEAMPRGARERGLRVDDWSPRTAFVRLPEAWQGQAADAAAIARLMVGIPYSFGSYAALAAWRFGAKTPRLETWINRRQPKAITLPRWSNGPVEPSPGVVRGGRLPVEAICSVLVDQAWTLAGARVMHGTKPQIVTPGGLAKQLLVRPGVAWGGPGILAAQ